MDVTDGFCTSVKVQFHEVDSMRIVHHSYYIYWMEQARFHFAEEMMGLTYADFERMDFTLPVVSLECKYSRSARLGQNISIYLQLEDKEETLAAFHYQMRDANTDELLFKGKSVHAFVNTQGKLLLRYPAEWVNAVKHIRQSHPRYIRTRG